MYTAGLYPWTPQGSLDPVTRIRGRNPGCGTRSENHWVAGTAEVLAGAFMFRVMGPPTGAYTGPYPTEAQALAVVAAGTPLTRAQLEDQPLNVRGLTLRADPSWLDSHVQERRPEEAVDPRVDLTPRAALWQGRCLIIRVPRDMRAGNPFADVYFIDVQRPQLFAMFCDRTPTLLPASNARAGTPAGISEPQ